MKSTRPVTKVVADNIAQIRRTTGWSQERFAERCGIHTNTLIRVESGSKNTTIVSLDKIAKSLGVNLTYLLEDHHD